MPSNKVEIDENAVIDYLNSERYDELLLYIKQKFTLTRDEAIGKPNLILVSADAINVLSSILKQLQLESPQSLVTGVELEVLKEVFRALRNAVAFNRDIQNLVVKNEIIIHSTEKIISNYIEKDKICVKIILQFLINMVTSNVDVAREIWGLLQTVLIDLFSITDYRYYAAALVYNIVYLEKSLIKECKAIYNHIIDGAVSEENEYNLFLLEMFLQEGNFINCYGDFEPNQRLIILSYLQDLIMSKEENFILKSDLLDCFIIQFKNKSDCILKTITNDVDRLEPQEVVILLEILASLCAKDDYRKQLQEDRSLLINCAFLLKTIHSAGKESENHFTPLQKLSDVKLSNCEAQKNPAFGFKASLIQFLGNAAWKNKANQDEMRELECIPLLLDCCNMDARNPFIIQWTILAVRNLCENNLANQEVIARMTRQGVVDSSTLQEMGLTLHDDGTSKISLLPLPQYNSK